MIRRACILALCVLAGCGGGSAPLPSDADAKQALQTALDAWKEGKAPASLTESKPSIDAVDFDWAAGQKLEAFTIGEESAGTGNRTFTVSLTIAGSAPKDVQYMVLGRDPIHVYRDEDFQRMLNMDNNPAPPPQPRR